MTYSGHWIDCDWSVQYRVMGTDKFSERHTANNISTCLENIRVEFQLYPIVSAIGRPMHSKVRKVAGNASKFFEAESFLDQPSITIDCGYDISCGVEVGERWDWNKCVCAISYTMVSKKA